MSQASYTNARPPASEKPVATTASGVVFQAVLATCLLGAVLLFYRYVYPLHHDLAGSLLSGRLAVALGSAYSDYSIYFPPAERIWFSLAVKLSDFSGLRPNLAVVAMTAFVVLIGCGLAYRIRQITVGASPLFLVCSVAVMVVVPILFKNVFGLREHMVAAGLWPYLVLRVSDPRSEKVGFGLRISLGIWMGTTLLFKYLYSAVVLLVEVAQAAMDRDVRSLFRSENVIAGGVVFFYLFLWLGIDPDQRAAIGAMFSAIDANLADPVTNALQVTRYAVTAVIVALLMRISKVPNSLIVIGLAAFAGAVVAAWAQERWYTHHLFPMTLVTIAWWWMAGRQLRPWCHAVLAFLVLMPLWQQFSETARYRSEIAELGEALAENDLKVAGQRVAILNAHPSPYNQYLAANSAWRWTPMMNNALVSTELKPFDTEENLGKPIPAVKLDDPGRRKLHEDMLRLWEDYPPDVLILDRTSGWPLHYINIDWKQAFSKDERFKAILAHYRPVLDYKGERLAFTYYVRAQ